MTTTKLLPEQTTAEPEQKPAADSVQPLLYRKREYLVANEGLGKTTSCQTTSNPDDYGPDD